MGILGKLFGKSDAAPNPYDNLRQQVLQIRREQLGRPARPESPIFGIVMDSGMGKSVATFVCLADGTVSLYLSTGGGVIGAGEHASVRAAGQELLEITNEYAAEYVAAASPGLQRRLPANGIVHFHLLTDSGVHSVECDETALAEERDPFAKLFSNCHTVLAEVREVADKPARQGW